MQTPSIIQKAVLLLSVLALLTSCKQETEPLVIPDSYDGSGFAANAATELAVRSQLSALSSGMKVGRDAANTVDAATLESLFEAGSPSLSTVATDYYGGLVEGWLPELAAASGQTYDWENAPAGNGGVLGSYLLDENGIELEQLVEKGLFAGALYNHAVTLVSGDITDATVDQLVAAWGAHPDFNNSDNKDLHTNADIFNAKYAARRDQNDGNGLYTTTVDQFIKLQAAVAAGEDYNTDRDDAITEIMELWEKGSQATVINYLQAAITKLSATDLDDAARGSGIHSYSEAVGFLHGFKTSTSPYRIITDAQIDELLELMNASGADATSYLLLTDAFNQLPKLQQAIDQIQTIYGFTNDEIESFRENWVSSQGR